MEEKGELIIHIGPPKTATTSLQFFLQELKLNDIVYGGIVQPRNNDLHSICYLAYKDILSGTNDNKKMIVSKINYYLSRNKYIFISEEMFLLESSNISWKKKVERIYNYFKEFNPTIVITARRPKKSIISFYHEIYHILQRRYKYDFNLFLKSKYCDIYKYYSLYKYLNQYFSKIIILDFEMLIKNKYYLSSLVFNNKTIKNINIYLKNENMSLKKDGRYYRKPTSLHGNISRVLNKISMMPLLKNFKGKGLRLKLLSNIPNFEFSPTNINFDFDQFDYSLFDNEYNMVSKYYFSPK